MVSKMGRNHDYTWVSIGIFKRIFAYVNLTRKSLWRWSKRRRRRRHPSRDDLTFRCRRLCGLSAAFLVWWHFGAFVWLKVWLADDGSRSWTVRTDVDLVVNTRPRHVRWPASNVINTCFFILVFEWRPLGRHSCDICFT